MYIEHEPWGISRRKGHHEPIITLATFEAIQDRKTQRAVAPKRKDLNQDFPLRGAVACACCDSAMTAYWAKSSTGRRYPYYNCQTRGCSEYRKGIRAEKIDTGFETILRALSPSKQLLDVAMAMVKDAWGQRMDQSTQAKSTLKRQIKELDKQQDALLERLIDSSIPKVTAAFETKIAKLEEDKLRLGEKLTQNTQPKASIGEIIELLKEFLASPWNIYENGSLNMKKTILKTAFRAPLAYDRKTGYRTPQVSVIFEFFDNLTSKCEMVRPRRLELPRDYLPQRPQRCASTIPPRSHMGR
jgi:site-specific DNA recombinase